MLSDFSIADLCRQASVRHIVVDPKLLTCMTNKMVAEGRLIAIEEGHGVQHWIIRATHLAARARLRYATSHLKGNNPLASYCANLPDGIDKKCLQIFATSQKAVWLMAIPNPKKRLALLQELAYGSSLKTQFAWLSASYRGRAALETTLHDHFLNAKREGHMDTIGFTEPWLCKNQANHNWRAYSVSYFLNHKPFKAHLIIVDAAHRLSDETLTQLMAHAQSEGRRIVLAGDGRCAGTGFVYPFHQLFTEKTKHIHYPKHKPKRSMKHKTHHQKDRTRPIKSGAHMTSAPK